MCKLRNKYRKLCRLRRRSQKRIDADSLVTLLKSNSRQFWRVFKKKRKATTGKCDFHKYFKDLNNYTSQIDNDLLGRLESNEQSQSNISVETLDCDISEAELDKAFKSLKRNKACGIDGVLNEFLLHCTPVMKQTILKLFNVILRSGFFPDIWAKGEIVPVFKKGNLDDPSNYRGLFLVSNVGKLFTFIINQRLNLWAEENSIFSENQYGFRKAKSVTDCIFIVHGLIEHFLNESKPVNCSFVDLKKAFDYTDRRCLWYKLKLNGISSLLIDLIKNMYSKIKLRVREVANTILDRSNEHENSPENNEFTPDDEKENFSSANEDVNEGYFSSSVGVFQGESLSPFLFSMFLNDLDSFLKQSDNVGVKLQQFLLTVLMFADDMVLFSTTREGLQSALDSLSKYCSTWGLTVNTDKTKCMAFKKGGKIGKQDKWTFENAQLETVNLFKYLGFVLSSSGKFSQSIAAIAEQAQRALFSLKSYIHTYPDLDLKTKMKMFNSLVTPIIEYACEVWGFCQADKLDTLYLGYLKSILGVRKTVPSVFLYKELNLYPLKLRRLLRIYKYWIKILSLPNSNPVRIVYNTLVEDNNSSPQTVNWVSLLKKVLNENGLGYFWNLQNELVEDKTSYLNIFKDRLQDIYLQNFDCDLRNLSENRLYKHIEHDFYGKDYLNIIKHNHLRIALTRLRLGSHNFMVERGRWKRPTVPFTHRLCRECDMIEDEFHIFFDLLDMQI